MTTKKRINKFYLYGIIALLLMFIIAYANIGTLLTINGVTNVRQNNWDIHFDNVDIPDGSIAKVDDIKLNGTSLDFTADLNLPGDVYEFNVDVVNDGTINAMIDEFEMLPDTLPVYLDYDVTWIENEEKPKKDDLVPSKESLTLKVVLKFKTDIDNDDLPSQDGGDSLRMSINTSYVQAGKDANKVVVPVFYASYSEARVDAIEREEEFITNGINYSTFPKRFQIIIYL